MCAIDGFEKMTEFGVAGDECIVGDHSGPCLFEVWERNETIDVFRAEIAADGEMKATFRSKMDIAFDKSAVDGHGYL